MRKYSSFKLIKRHDEYQARKNLYAENEKLNANSNSDVINENSQDLDCYEPDPNECHEIFEHLDKKIRSFIGIECRLHEKCNDLILKWKNDQHDILHSQLDSLNQMNNFFDIDEQYHNELKLKFCECVENFIEDGMIDGDNYSDEIQDTPLKNVIYWCEE